MQTAGTVLFVGDDLCARVKVLATVGYDVLRCSCEANPFREALVQSPVEVVLFQCVPEPPSPLVLATARALTTAPIILFASHSAPHDPREYDAVLPALCSPREWLPQITEAIASCRNPDRAKKPHRHEPIDAPKEVQ